MPPKRSAARTEQPLSPTRSRADNGRRVSVARNSNQWGGGTLVMRSVFKPPQHKLSRGSRPDSVRKRQDQGRSVIPEEAQAGPSDRQQGRGAQPCSSQMAQAQRHDASATLATPGSARGRRCPHARGNDARPHEEWAKTIPRSHFRHAIIHKCECEEHATSRF